ncbi:methyltransferase [Streptococcus infantarius subsp. infantarius]|jgi:release factor glutamine methyltransferase|uniref:Release factor glutamine methyltransferase n=2 Tax=Streptococcus infantarius TaxID=102684 RepID=A0A380KNE3_9STRE|nr:peptide chain release factor N(5)-glutamine methyltransferase [Streptococcus infantarius]EDT47401.1 protein-(glutamine-N5) methyltransferase, release factor-specific [Streptococcus infantarius subsp. infantarius ATCC BAA-102]MBT0895864.1 peptide chain release factor N(5)-glutamine methyltransferase [Streptococcus infantarius subsp. infantarius]MBT0899754.1 peptide chain release factor N(5)-glutamine methyltransferase [Streptococcus infantarius subsp. infantarius]MBT0903921.1 peptide chain re
MNYVETISQLEKNLQEIGEDPENLTYVFRELKSWSLLDFILHQNKEVTESDQKILESIMAQLEDHRSPQYITGKAYFRDLELAVDERVLIPRPETEELVDLVLKENSKADLRVLDIGTGSGAIAISLKSARPDWQVTASDISQGALQLAEENSKLNQVSLDFVESDVFGQITGTFDVIISNPPYIAYGDKDEVGMNVLASEPHLALFADEDGFAIYRQIIEGAGEHLSENGKLYFEIGYKQGDGLRALLSKHFPQKRIRVLEDIFGKDRKVVMDND